MGFRFRRRLRVFPGVYLNLSKSGVSTSIGGRGATVNFNDRGVQTSVGLPGSGLSYRSSRQPYGAAVPQSRRGSPIVPIIIALWVLGALAFVITR